MIPDAIPFAGLVFSIVGMFVSYGRTRTTR